MNTDLPTNNLSPTPESDHRLMVARSAMMRAETEFQNNPTDENFNKSKEAYHAWAAIIDERREARRKAERAS